MIIVHYFVLGLILINGILLVRNIKIKMDLQKQITEYASMKSGCNDELEILKKEFDKALDALEPLRDKQQNCKRGEWCRACNFYKTGYIHTYPQTLNYGTPYSYRYCAKGICQEFIKKEE